VTYIWLWTKPVHEDPARPRWDRNPVLGYFRVSSVSDQPITQSTHICIQYRYKIHQRARDSSQMCDNKVHAQATCAPDDDAQSTAEAHSGRNRARALRARAPNPGVNHTRFSRSPRRYARSSWTPRCARALICDRAACGQHRAGVQRCKGYARAGASHLLSIDADEDLDALSKQGVM
jgi:hypothetical protein